MNLGQISERKKLSTSFKALYKHYKNRDIDTNIIGEHVFYMLSILVKNPIRQLIEEAKMSGISYGSMFRKNLL